MPSRGLKRKRQRERERQKEDGGGGGEGKEKWMERAKNIRGNRRKRRLNVLRSPAPAQGCHLSSQGYLFSLALECESLIHHCSQARSSSALLVT